MNRSDSSAVDQHVKHTVIEPAPTLSQDLPMKSKATTVEQYLASLPDDRRAAVSTVHSFILDNLDKNFHECMQYGVIAYCVPHSVWPHGHHTRPELPLMYMGLSSQKNDMVVYMLCLLHNKPMREWFDTAWKATGKNRTWKFLERGAA